MTITEPICNYLMRVGMSSRQSHKSYPFNVQNSTILFILFLGITTTVMYLISEAKNLKEYTDSVYFIITFSSSTINFIFVNWNMREIFQFLDKLEDTINTRLQNSTLKTIYTQTGEKIRKFSAIFHFAFTKMNPIFVAVPAAIGSFFAYFTTELGTDAFVLPFPTMWLPFDVKNPLRYSIAAAIQFLISFIVGHAVVSVLVIVIAPCLVLISTADDMKCGLSALNTSARTKESDFKITQQFNQFVQFHSKGKQLANDFSKLVQYIFVDCFAWAIGSICLTMFATIFEWRENAPNSIVFQSVILLTSSFIFVYLPCEFGHKLSNSFIEIDHAIGQMYWYKFPKKMWKMLPFVIAATQDPIQLRVFGSTSCSRDDFKGVVNLGFSYFMVLQKFVN